MKKSRFSFLVSIVLILSISFLFISWSSKNKKDDALSKRISMKTQTIEGDNLNNEIYNNNDITLIHFMSTRSESCLEEIIELGEINSEDNGIGIISIVYNTYNSKNGKLDIKALYEAIRFKQKSGVNYPFVIPNDEIINSTLKNRNALLPMYYIVDNKGKIIEGPFVGVKSKDEWLTIIRKVKNKILESSYTL